MREFRNTTRTGKTRVWRIEAVGDQVITEYGDLGGKMQKVSDTAKAKNVGRSNELSAEEAAVQQMERLITKKTRGGYRELGEPERENEIDFDDLPLNLSFYKPDNSLSATLLKLVEQGASWFSRKRDGEMMVIVANQYGDISIYSRKMLKSHHLEPDKLWTERFPHIVDDLYEYIPPNTILLGEMVHGIEEDNRWALASIMKSKTGEALALQEKHGPAYFYCWDIAFWEGEDWVSTKTVAERYIQINNLFFAENMSVLPVEFFDADDLLDRAIHELGHEKTFENNREMAMFVADGLGWEGWVVVDPDGIYGDKAYNFRGKVDRPGKYSGKLKPEFEGDFIAFFCPDADIGNSWGKWGRGKHQGKVGAVSLFQYSSSDELVYICECGGGMDDEFRKLYSSPESYPLVLEVKYTSRTYKSDGDKTNALQFPRVVRVRTDKTEDECINERL